MEKVAKEVATEEVNKWLDCKKLSDSDREQHKDSIDRLVSFIMDGVLTLKDDTTFVHTLKFPIEDITGKPAMVSVEYKTRLALHTIHAHMQGVKNSDAFGMIVAYISALTGKPKEMIKKMDTSDYSVGSAIAVFFL